MKFKKVKGYIFSREINGTIIPQKVQNLVIREYCKNKNYIYQLSSVEHKMKNTFHVLDEVLNSLSNVNGIVMYSIFQLPYEEKKEFLSSINYLKNQNLYHLRWKTLLSKIKRI